MAKYIRYPDPFLDARGFPVAMADPDPRVQQAAIEEHNAELKEERDAAKETGEKPSGRRQFQPPIIHEASLSDLVCAFADSIPYGPEPKESEPKLRSSPTDRAHARKIIGTFVDRPDGQDYVALDDNAWTWATGELERNGDLIWSGTLSERVLECLRDELSAREVADIEEQQRAALGLPPVLAGPGAESSAREPVTVETSSAAEAPGVSDAP
jgi:hypothetical protein